MAFASPMNKSARQPNLAGCLDRVRELPNSPAVRPGRELPVWENAQRGKVQEIGGGQKAAPGIYKTLPRRMPKSAWYAVPITRTQKAWLSPIARECGLNLRQLVLGLALGLWSLPREQLGLAPTGGRMDRVRLRLDDRQWRELSALASKAALPLEQFLHDVPLGMVQIPGGADRVPLRSLAESELRQALQELIQLALNEPRQRWTRYQWSGGFQFRPSMANQENIRKLDPLIRQLKARRQLGLTSKLESELLFEKIDLELAKIRGQIK